MYFPPLGVAPSSGHRKEQNNNKKSPEMGLSKRQTEYLEQGWEGVAGWQGRDGAEATEGSTGPRD